MKPTKKSQSPETELRRAAVRISDSRGLLFPMPSRTRQSLLDVSNLMHQKSQSVNGCLRLDRDA